MRSKVQSIAPRKTAEYLASSISSSAQPRLRGPNCPPEASRWWCEDGRKAFGAASSRPLCFTPGGEGGFTFRALGAHLKTDAGAIYWHVANKRELLIAASNAVLAPVLTTEAADLPPDNATRALAREIFDAIGAHPWVGSELSRSVSTSAMLRIFQRIGRQV